MNKIYSYYPYKIFNIEYLSTIVAQLSEIEWTPTPTYLASPKKLLDLTILSFSSFHRFDILGRRSL